MIIVEHDVSLIFNGLKSERLFEKYFNQQSKLKNVQKLHHQVQFQEEMLIRLWLLKWLISTPTKLVCKL